jgi:hypothetical protein
MNRSKRSLKAIMLVSGIGLAAAALGGSQPAAAQSYSDDYSCPAGYIYDPSYGCTLSGSAYEPYNYGYYGDSPYYGGYGSYYGSGQRDFGHGFAHGMGGGFAHDHGGGVNHGAGFAHGGGGGFGHGMGGGFGHGGGGGHR